MNKNEKISPPFVGATTLLVIFGVLCMSVFALLSLSTALAEKRLVDSFLGNIESYYQAEYQAQITFAQLRKGEELDNVEKKDNIYTFSQAITPMQKLQVEVENTDKKRRIIRWQNVPIDDAFEEDINLWDGETIP